MRRGEHVVVNQDECNGRSIEPGFKTSRANKQDHTQCIECAIRTVDRAACLFFFCKKGDVVWI